MKKTVFFDLETGGLDPDVHPITQIALVAVDEEFNVCEELELKLMFDVGVCSDDALAVNSYDADTWKKEAVSQQQAMAHVSSFLKRHATVKMISKRGSPYYVAQLAGHNAATFDGPFLQKWYRRADQFMPAGYRVLCTLQLAQWHFYNHASPPSNMKLGTLCNLFGISLPPDEAHDALADVRANVKLARLLIGDKVECSVAGLRRIVGLYPPSLVLEELMQAGVDSNQVATYRSSIASMAMSLDSQAEEDKDGV